MGRFLCGVRRQKESEALTGLLATPLWIPAERRNIRDQKSRPCSATDDSLGKSSDDLGFELSGLPFFPLRGDPKRRRQES